ncbi:MAG: hypothetical protein PHI90_06965, partial [Clostridia bacterium]|nr:hypothetical protein [Clostridia bacterium]
MRNKKDICKAMSIMLIFFVLMLTIQPALAQEDKQIVQETEGTEETEETVEAIEVEKDASDIEANKKIKKTKDQKTSTQKKISTDLLYLLDESFIPESMTQKQVKKQMISNKQYRALGCVTRSGEKNSTGDMVYVYINLKPNASTKIIKPYVNKIENKNEKNHIAVAWVELGQLEALASLDGVRNIRTVLQPLVRTGSVTSQGDSIHLVDQVRDEFGYDGTNIKIGVISNGVDSIADAISAGDLPNYLASVGESEHVISNNYGGEEGTAMLEIIHDLAPGAELYFHDCGSNTVGFNEAIDALVNSGCQVIVDDIGWLGEPCFEDGFVANH